MLLGLEMLLGRGIISNPATLNIIEAVASFALLSLIVFADDSDPCGGSDNVIPFVIGKLSILI